MSANDRESLQMSELLKTGDSALESRVSLWTMPAKWGGAFFVLLVGQGGVLIGLHVWRAVVVAPGSHVVDTVLSEVLVGTPMMVFAGILSMIELEAALTLSVWYERRSRLKDKEEFEAGRRKGRAEGRELGYQEAIDEALAKAREDGIAEGRRLERAEIRKSHGARLRHYPI